MRQVSQALTSQDTRVLGLQAPGTLTPKWSKAASQAVGQTLARGIHGGAKAQAAGYIASARIEATELVTERAMLGVHRLHQVRQALGASDPIEADELSGLIREFTLVSRMEVRNLTREW